MSSIRKLAHQTIWYGGSYVAAKFLNVFLKFVLTHIIAVSNYGVVTKVYIYSTFLAVLFTYGMETTYFRYIQKHKNKQELFNTSFSSLIGSSLLFFAIMYLSAGPIADIWRVADHPEWIRWIAIILTFDALASIPFARLRQEQRPVKYAFVKFINIFLQVVLTLYFLLICPMLLKQNTHSIWVIGYNPSIGVGYVFIANLIASVLTLGFLYKELAGFQFRITRDLWKSMMLYSWPLVIVGFGGMINEVMDRILLDYMLPYTQQHRDAIIGVYQVGYLFASLINIFIQIFRMGAEPFFFNESNQDNAQHTYARVMKFFVIGSCWMFLAITLFTGLWKYLNLVDIRHYPAYSAGFSVIPQLALGYVCLGVYYNLSIWYKLTNKTAAGALITVAGALITLVLNIWWIPKYTYVGSAWATLICYFIMMALSFAWGQKHYPVPYAWKKLLGYMLLAVTVLMLQRWIHLWIPNLGLDLIMGAVLLLGYIGFTMKVEHQEFSRLPVIGKYLAR